MAHFTFKLPDIGEGIAEAEIVAWHVAVGDRIEEDAPLADMLTDKATVEIETPVAGTVVALGGAVGANVAIGAMLAVIDADGDSDDPAAIEQPAPAAPAPAPAQKAAPAAMPTAITPVPPPAAPLASPAVRARAKALGVDLTHVHSSGGHIRHADLDAFLRYGAAEGYRGPAAVAGRPDETIPVIGLRRRIARNMAEAKRHIAHFTYVEEVEVTALEAMRGDLNAHRGAESSTLRPKLTLLPFLITALARALADFPMLNAHYDDGADGAGEDGGTITRFGAVHMGVATQTPAGLMVPVLRDAHALNIWQIAGEVARLAQAAREGTARREELAGSTITITSLGALGGIASTPVINRPEVAIIGVGRMIERAMFVDDTSDRIRRARVLNLSLSCDHRVVDGWDAARFVAEVKRLIEAPALLLAP